MGAPDDDGSIDGSDPVGESRWPVVITMVLAVGAQVLMPATFVPGPRWLLTVIQVAFLVAVLVSDPGRIDRRSRGVRIARLGFVVVLAFGASWAAAALVYDIVHAGAETNSATLLLRAGGLVWASTVFSFGFLYWELDSGGPGQRAHETPRYPDLLFPLHLNPDLARPGWRPVFVDYLYLGLTNALAFSPTDVMPSTHWPKLAMGIQSVLSLLILGLVVARAVNILA